MRPSPNYIGHLLSTDAPKINCSVAEAYVGDRNVAVGCTVRAKPPVSALFWIIDDNGTSVSEGDPITDHWTLESVCTGEHLPYTDRVIDFRGESRKGMRGNAPHPIVQAYCTSRHSREI